MKLIKTVAELRQWRKEHDDVALVPTMGNLHDGHISLVKAAKKRSKHVVVSIFVNPIQFGEGEDFDNYPRTLEEDVEKLEKAGADVAFAPSVKEMYPKGEQTYFVEPSSLKNELCGKFRPIHFRGVCTVVMKLFNIVTPDTAFFGKKDYQQFVILKNMIEEFNMGIEINAVDIARSDDGLALSSRNRYLSEEERKSATLLSETLRQTAQTIKNGEDMGKACSQAINNLTLNGWKCDYVEVRRRSDLAPATPEDKELVILAAARIGTTRLIDNLEFDV